MNIHQITTFHILRYTSNRPIKRQNHLVNSVFITYTIRYTPGNPAMFFNRITCVNGCFSEKHSDDALRATHDSCATYGCSSAFSDTNWIVLKMTSSRTYFPKNIVDILSIIRSSLFTQKFLFRTFQMTAINTCCS